MVFVVSFTTPVFLAAVLPILIVYVALQVNIICIQVYVKLVIVANISYMAQYSP